MVSISDTKKEIDALGKAEIRNLRLQQEISNIKQEISEKEKKKEAEQKSLNIGWNCLGGCGCLALIMVVMAQDDKRWWGGFFIFLLFALLGLSIIVNNGGKVKKINQQIKKLKKQEKELRNSIR